MAGHLPDVRVLAMLRDPVERAYSAYKHEVARGFETESFETAIELEDTRLEGEAERMVDDPGYRSFSHRHHGYLHRGQYAEQLARMRRSFPAERIHVIDSESFFEHPEETYSRRARLPAPAARAAEQVRPVERATQLADAGADEDPLA